MSVSSEQLYFGGHIYTMDDECPNPEALAVKYGRIVAVGTKQFCRGTLGNRYEAVDLAGCALLPGFIDTHLHPTLMIYYDLCINLQGILSTGELQEVIRRAANQRGRNPWIVGLQFDDLAIYDARGPVRVDLDAACAERPVIVVTFDGHRVIANTRAIEAAGITAGTPDPMGGIIDREPDGYPTGVFREAAAQMLIGKAPFPDMEDLLSGAAATFKNIAACGITSVGVILQTGDEGPAGSNGAFDLPFMEILLDKIPINLYCLLVAQDAAPLEAARRTSLHQSEGNPGRTVGGLKIYCDGTIQSGTASFKEPYADQDENRGLLTLPPEEIYTRMVSAHRAGFQVAIHSIGDAANWLCVDLYDRLFKEYPSVDRRHRLEHASVLNTGLVADIARLGLVVSSQPLFIHSEKHWLHKKLGFRRAAWTYPFKSLVEAGIRFAGASDAPVQPLDVLHAIQCCVTREGFETAQGISAARAVRAYTLDAAYAQFEEKCKGSLSPGKRADMVVLSANPVFVRPEEIRRIEVRQTICGGITVYQA